MDNTTVTLSSSAALLEGNNMNYSLVDVKQIVGFSQEAYDFLKLLQISTLRFLYVFFRNENVLPFCHLVLICCSYYNDVPTLDVKM